MLNHLLLAALVSTPSSITDRIETAVRTTQLPDLLAIRAELKTDLETANANHRTELQYLLGYVGWRSSHLMRGRDDLDDEREEVLKEAQKTLESVVEARPKDGESHALLASVLGMRIDGSFFRGIRLGPRSSALLDKAVALAPESPRVALLQGIRAVYTPSMFGGGVEQAQAAFDRAFLLSDKEGEAPWPNWGRVDIFAWRGQLALKRGDRAGAMALYERALTETPDARWIRDELLPAARRGHD
ncbi:MAG: hypothetical protein AAFV29_03195 [Myxococcota bacterium]